MRRIVPCLIAAAALPTYAQGFLTPRGEHAADPPSQVFRLASQRVEIDLDHQYATTTLTQEFENLLPARIEGAYTLRTSGGTLAEGFAYWNGEEKIVGEVFERSRARAVYDQIVRLHRDPGLLEHAGEGAFSFNVFPIEPRELKRIQIRFGQRLARHGDVLEYRLPLAEAESEVIAEVQDDHPILEATSPSADLEVERIGLGHLRLHARAPGGSDLVLRFRLDAPPWKPKALVHRDPGQDAYLVLQLAAPQTARSQVSAKAVTVVIDRSGSMTGEPLVQAKKAAQMVVGRLRPDDRVNVIAFDDSVDALYLDPRPVEEAGAAALRYIGGIGAGGGTDIAAALRKALSARVRGMPHVVLFLTDGQSPREPALKAAMQEGSDARVFTLGLGNQVDKPLLSRIAALRRGRFTFIESASAIETRVGRLFDQIESPILVGLSLEARGATLLRTYPRTLPDLAAGDDLLVTARMRPEAKDVRLVLRGTLAGKDVALPVTVEVPQASRHPWAARLWARSRVDDLLETIAMEGKQPELESEVTKLGLAYELVTPYTSFLAVPEKELTPAQRLTLAEGRAERTDALAQDSGAAALSRRRMPPGDPILTVAAPTDAVQVTAYFRFGLVRDLKWDARLERWTVRFLVPKGTPDGEYDVPVLIVLPDGSMTVEMARYVVDSREPGFSVTATRVKGGVRVRVETAELSRRAVAVLGKTRVELRGDGRAFEGLLRGASAGRLRVVVADLARNEGEREVLIP